MENTITKDSSDAAIIEAYIAGNNAGLGYSVGEEGDTLTEAALSEFNVVRTLSDGSLLCEHWLRSMEYSQDASKGLVSLLVIADSSNGPWGVTVA